MLLQAVEIGLNGICIGAFNRRKIMEELQLKYPPLLILAIARGSRRSSWSKSARQRTTPTTAKTGRTMFPRSGWRI